MYKKIAAAIYENSNKKSDVEVLEFGLRIFFGAVMQIIVLAILSWLAGIFVETMCAAFAGATLRVFSGGAHARTQAKCILSGTIIYLLLGFGAAKAATILPSHTAIIAFVTVIFIVAFYTVYKKAPVESENKPITGEEQRKRLRRMSFVVTGIFLLTSVMTVFLSYNISLAFSFGILWQTLTLYDVFQVIYEKI